MLKRLAILAVAVLLLQVAIISVLFPNHTAKADGEDKGTASDQNPPPPPSATLPSNPVATPHNPESDQRYAPTPQQDDPYVRWGVIINGVLVVVTLIIAIAAVIQASAAKQSAQAQLNAERALMFPRITQPDYRDVLLLNEKPDDWSLSVEVRIKNHGNTPAVALRALFDYSSEKIRDHQTQTWVLDLPEPPQYAGKIEPYAPGAIYDSGEDTPMYLPIPKSFLGVEGPAWVLKQKCLCVRGYVEYLDTFERPHITRFCYVFQDVSQLRRIERLHTGKPEIPWEFRKAGPDAYNQFT